MVVEHAVLEVVPGQEDAFEATFALAKGIIAAAEGFRSLRLSRCVETPGLYDPLPSVEHYEDLVVVS